MTAAIVPEGWEPRRFGLHGLEIARALLRPGTYLGYAHEAVSVVADVVAFPLGIVGPDPATPRPRWAAHSTPVLLVHGYGHNRSAWVYLAARLRDAGITDVETFDYNPLFDDVPTLGARLRQKVSSVLSLTGERRVDVVGHSLGGIVARWMIEECDGWDAVRTCVTVSTPHSGTLAALLGPGRTARQLRPGSDVIRRLEDDLRPSRIRWISYYTNIDALVVPASSAKLVHPSAVVENVLIKDMGHLGVLRSSLLAADITARLCHPSAA